jgi:hypothetical protein
MLASAADGGQVLVHGLRIHAGNGDGHGAGEQQHTQQEAGAPHGDRLIALIHGAGGPIRRLLVHRITARGHAGAERAIIVASSLRHRVLLLRHVGLLLTLLLLHLLLLLFL